MIIAPAPLHLDFECLQSDILPPHCLETGLTFGNVLRFSDSRNIPPFGSGMKENPV